jgi:predicted DNA-binding ribbon-helix-helix protein
LTPGKINGRSVVLLLKNLEAAVQVEETSLGPITTPDYLDPDERVRTIHGFYGYDYVFLEDAIWNALCAIARREGQTVDELCVDIDRYFADVEGFPPAARAYVLRYVAKQISEKAELPGELQAFAKLGNRGSAP